MFEIAIANFGIDRKRTVDGKIAELLVHRQEANGTMRYLGWYTRQSIIDSINEGQKYMTIRIDEKLNQWFPGAQIHVVPTYHGSYLRTDRNQIAADNLDSLPEG